MADHNTHTKTGAREVFLRTIAIVGLIAVLVLGAWGIILLAFNLPSVFSNAGSYLSGAFTNNDDDNNGNTPSSTLVVTAPQNVTSGNTFQLGWDHQGVSSNDYTYTLTYACESGLSIKAPRANGSYEVVNCDTPFNFVGASENMRLIPTLSSAGTKAAVITVTATDMSGNPVAFSPAIVNVTRAAAAVPTTPSTPTNNNSSQTYVAAATQATQLYGSADLATRIISVTPAQGYYGNYNNQTRRYTMQFEISNVGTNVAQNGWNFNTLIPWTPNTYTFTSQAQQTLYPGDKIVYTLGFDAYVDGVVCTLQYPNNCQYQNPNYNYQNNYNQNVTCGYRYNGYTNIYACGYTDVNGNWVDVGTNYNQNYNNQYNYPYNYNRSVTVNADAGNWIWESNENNNRATTYLTY